MELLDSKAELGRFSAVHSPRLVVAWVDPSSEEEEEMAFNPRRGLKDLVAGRNKRSSSKEVPKSRAADNLPPPPPLPTTSLSFFVVLMVDYLFFRDNTREGNTLESIYP